MIEFSQEYVKKMFDDFLHLYKINKEDYLVEREDNSILLIFNCKEKDKLLDRFDSVLDNKIKVKLFDIKIREVLRLLGINNLNLVPVYKNNYNLGLYILFRDKNICNKFYEYLIKSKKVKK